MRAREDSTTPLGTLDLVPADPFETALVDLDGRRFGAARSRGGRIVAAGESHVRRVIAEPFAPSVRQAPAIARPAFRGTPQPQPAAHELPLDVSEEDTLRLRRSVLAGDRWWRRAVGGTLLALGGAAAWLADVLLRTGAQVRSRPLFG